MTRYQLDWTKKSIKDLDSFPKDISERILDKTEFYCNQENPLKYAKKLSTQNTYRFRIGNYRVIFEIDKKGIVTILLVLTVKHRKEAYQ